LKSQAPAVANLNDLSTTNDDDNEETVSESVSLDSDGGHAEEFDHSVIRRKAACHS
jgi:hypothetical protein